MRRHQKMNIFCVHLDRLNIIRVGIAYIRRRKIHGYSLLKSLNAMGEGKEGKERNSRRSGGLNPDRNPNDKSGSQTPIKKKNSKRRTAPAHTHVITKAYVVGACRENGILSTKAAKVAIQEHLSEVCEQTAYSVVAQAIAQ